MKPKKRKSKKDEVVFFKIEALKEHEEIRPDYLEALKNEILADGILKMPICIDEKTCIILDGHHRLQALKRLGCKKIPCVLVDYQSENISVIPWREGETITKETIIDMALSACTRHKVMVTNTPGVLDDTTADFTWTLLLATARRLIEADQHLRSSQWNGWKLMEFLGSDVHHKTLGICGLGRIGQGVARRAKGFDMQILYTDLVRATQSVEKELGASFVDKKTLLAQSDFVTLHLPLEPADDSLYL